VSYKFLLWLLVCSLLVPSAHASESDPKLKIYWIDVEGGAATLIVTPAGESVLIDAGNPGHRDPDRIVQTAVKTAGLKKIDHLIITHYHVDHFGGASMLAKMLPIGSVYDNGIFDNMPNHPSKDYLEFKAESRRQLQPGEGIPLRQVEGQPSISIRCLGTRQSFVAPQKETPANELLAQHKPKNRDGSDNANSVVLLLEYGEFEFFDAGDLTWNQEIKLVAPHDLVGPVDVYQVTHHGLDSSNNPVLVNQIRPTVAIMNNGTKKGCHPEVFQTLKSSPSIQAIFQMHRNLRPDGEVNNSTADRIANQEADCSANAIVLEVSQDSKSFNVSIPAKSHTEHFSTK